MHFIAVMRAWIQNAIENDGSERDRQATRGGYERMLSSIGIGDDSDVKKKAKEVCDLLPELLALAQRVMEANPRIDR